MKRSLTGTIAPLALAVGIAGCNALGIAGDDENEVRVTIVELSAAADFLVADDGFTYEVTTRTEYEGIAGFAELAVNDVVEIEYANIANSSNRRALEIEAGDYDDRNPDD